MKAKTKTRFNIAAILYKNRLSEPICEFVCKSLVGLKSNKRDNDQKEEENQLIHPHASKS